MDHRKFEGKYMKKSALAPTEHRGEYLCGLYVSLQVVIDLALTSSVHGRWLDQ